MGPPLLPGATAITAQPFWIYYWQDHEVWQVDSGGEQHELIFATHEREGEWLTGLPYPLDQGTDCCSIDPLVTVSPDGQKLALLLVNKLRVAKGEPFTFTIHILDLRTRTLTFVSEGIDPAWSPDSRRLAFSQASGLWIATLDSGQVRERVHLGAGDGGSIGGLVWSRDGTRLAYLSPFGMVAPGLWVVDADDQTPPRQLIEPSASWLGAAAWSAKGDRIFFISPEGGRDPRYDSGQYLWAVSVSTGERVQLLRDISVDGPLVSPDGQWLVFSAFPRYERGGDDYWRDLWALRTDGQELRRLTANQDLLMRGFTPDGAGLVVEEGAITAEGRVTAYVFSLHDGAMTPLPAGLVRNEYAIGSVK